MKGDDGKKVFVSKTEPNLVNVKVGIEFIKSARDINRNFHLKFKMPDLFLSSALARMLASPGPLPTLMLMLILMPVVQQLVRIRTGWLADWLTEIPI